MHNLHLKPTGTNPTNIVLTASLASSTTATTAPATIPSFDPQYDQKSKESNTNFFIGTNDKFGLVAGYRNMAGRIYDINLQDDRVQPRPPISTAQINNILSNSRHSIGNSYDI